MVGLATTGTVEVMATTATAVGTQEAVKAAVADRPDMAMEEVTETAGTAMAVDLAALATAGAAKAVVLETAAAKVTGAGTPAVVKAAMEEAVATGEVRETAVDTAALAGHPAEGLDQVAGGTAIMVEMVEVEATAAAALAEAGSVGAKDVPETTELAAA